MPSPLPQSLVEALPGRFLAFEGPDGSGKSTQLRRFVADCRDSGLEPVEVREPGGTHVGEHIRRVLLEHGHEPIGARCEMLLYMASRAQLVELVIKPALAAQRLVIADRFVASTLAYQGTAGGVPAAHIARVADIAIDGAMPDLTVVFDVDQETASARLSPLLDRMEAKGRAFHERVRAGYHAQIAADPAHFLTIDAARPPDAVYADLLAGLATRIPVAPPRATA